MADNYLEKRMDDLRSGRLSSNIGKSNVKRIGMLQFPFPERRVLITGGCHGIGLAIVRSFQKVGCKVAVFDSDKEAGHQLALREGVRFHHVELSNISETEKALDELFRVWHDLDIVINNAGISGFDSIENTTVEEFDRILNVNLRPAFIIARKLALHRRTLPYPNPFGGRFLLISSTRHLQSEKGTEAYSASKGALASLSHALMMSLSRHGITVNCISPGWILTKEEKLTETDCLQHPSRRVGSPEDIARLALFLCAPDNDFINGADIIVDGGMTHKMIYAE